MPVTDFILVVYLSVPPACLKDEVLVRYYMRYMITGPGNYFVKHILVAASAALKMKILLVLVN